MDLSQAKDVTIMAAPLIKVLVDEFIAPKVRALLKKKGVSITMTSHSFENQFEHYLIESYKKYSTPNILVLGNQQRQLKDIYVPLEVVKETDEEERHLIDGFHEEFIPCYKKTIIIDTAGMGKSTISKRLFLAAVEQKVGVPILIELRRLKKDKKMIDEIFRQLSMINEKANEEFVLELIRKGGFVFMLDGFDEIEHEERKDVVEDIRNFVDKAGKNYFLLTSRPEDALGAFGDFMSFSIRSLRIDEAYSLLKNYDSDGEVSTLLISKLEESENENVKEFLENPLLVSLLYAAFEHKHTIPLKKHLFYRQVYDAFFERHDLTKGDSFIRNKYSKLESDDFHRVLRFIGYKSLTADRTEFSKDELIKLIESAKVFCVDLKFAASDFLKDILTKVPLFVEDGLYIKWAHKSIQEYFAANFIYNDSKSKQGAILVAIAKDNDFRFINLLDIYCSIDFKSFRRYIIRDLLESYLGFLGRVRKTWPDASGEVVSILFQGEFFFTKYFFDKKSHDIDGFEYALRRLTIDTEYKDRSVWGVYMDFFNEQELFGNIKVQRIADRRAIGVMIDSLSRKGLEFLKVSDKRPLKKGLNYDYSKLPFEENKYYRLYEEDSDIVFKAMSSAQIESLLLSFIPYVQVFSEEESIKLLKEVDLEEAKEKSDEFLMEGF